jgi:protein SERAC1
VAQAIAEHVIGIVFLGTPFACSNLAKWGDLVRAIFNVVYKTDQTTLKTLKENSHDLIELGTAFPETS